MTLKDAKFNFIIDVATKLFLDRGINSITIKDIAKEVGFGEATFYRYFSKKSNIVLAVAMKLESDVYKQYFVFNKDRTGYDRLFDFYNGYIKIFNEHQEFYRFINEFDSYILNEGNLPLEDYERGLTPFYQSFIDSYNEGLTDGSIHNVDDINRFYFTTTHALLGLCKKLASGDILSQDNIYQNIDELKTLVNIIMFRLKK